MEFIILSPHLDDAVFSLGASCAKFIQQGQQGLIATFCTALPEHQSIPKKMKRYFDYDLRFHEDKLSLEQLGMQKEYLNFVERALLPPIIKSLPGVFTTPPSIDGFTQLDAKKQAVLKLCEQHPNAIMYAPLGVGNHFDHVETFLACFLAMKEGNYINRFAYYEDAYAFGLTTRKKHFVTKNLIWPKKISPERINLRSRGMFTLLQTVSSGPSTDSYIPELQQSYSWFYKKEPIAPFQSTQLAAIAHYKSQTDPLGGYDNWCEITKRYHRCLDDCDVFWYPQKL